MRDKILLRILRTALLCLLAGPLLPCTTFCFGSGDAWYFGRNYDWTFGDGLVMVNKRGISKVALLALSPSGASDQAARWTSRYGSVTFNQYGREFPLGGMNERGLVIECMWLGETKYPKADARPALSTLQWIQRGLDTCATVQEVLALDATVRILYGDTPLHFLVCDQKGEAAAVEFLDGRMVARTGKDLPLRALANSTYQSSLASWQRRESALPSDESLRRFIQASRGVQAWEDRSAQDAVSHAFGVLRSAAHDTTVFSVVYDLKEGWIHFRTRTNVTGCTIHARRLDFSPATPVGILDIQTSLVGDVTERFAPYTRQANLDLLRKAVAKSPKRAGLAGLREQDLQAWAAYPETPAGNP